MQGWDPIDIKLTTVKFTWSNKRVDPGYIVARLDRFLVQSSFLLLGLETRMHILHNNVSNHKPISRELLSHKDLGPIPFRFSSLWIKETYIMEKVRDYWKDLVKGSAFFSRRKKSGGLKSC